MGYVSSLESNQSQPHLFGAHFGGILRLWLDEYLSEYSKSGILEAEDGSRQSDGFSMTPKRKAYVLGLQVLVAPVDCTWMALRSGRVNQIV